MHHSCNVDVYLDCASRPIIEDCTGIRFAELPRAYAKMLGVGGEYSGTVADGEGDDDGGEGGESAAKGENMYSQVDDFKWLKSDPSPNWEVMADEEKVKDEVWTQVLEGQDRAGVGVEELLTEVGLGK